MLGWKTCATILAAALFLAGCATITGKSASAPEATLEDFHLAGDLTQDSADFTLNVTARITNPKGAALDLLTGPVALTQPASNPHWRLEAQSARFVAKFDRAGTYPLELKFRAAVTHSNTWSRVAFHVAPAAIQPVVLRGLGADTQFELGAAARPEREGSDFLTYLPADGTVTLAWKTARPETEGKLFYAAEVLSQVGVAPGLMRQTALLNLRIMQGELSRVAIVLHGQGEVTRVQGEQVLAWNIEPGIAAEERKLIVQFNQPQKELATFQIQTQTPLDRFPQAVDVPELRPENAVRYTGWFRVVNEGAVRLEVTQAKGLTQTAPEQFPESDTTRALLQTAGGQRFVYRYAGGDIGLRITADQILPELNVSELLAYRYGENELAIEGEFEVEVREAPVRELLLRIPKGYAVARLNASGLSDHFLHDIEDSQDAELRLVFSQPMSGRQLIQLRLERNQALTASSWLLPRLAVSNAKSVRGHIAVSADAGFRLTPERTEALTEIATAFFPRKLAGIQSAFRLSEPTWRATVRVEKLPQVVQAHCFHLFSIGEGIAYGSSLMNISISGAPVGNFRIELSDEYANVEFTGKDVRSWQKTNGGYVVQLHTPSSGTCTLLASYERPFKNQGETLAFTGARPIDAQSEQGYTVVISAYQFQVKPAEVSGGLLALEPGELPAEYRLFFDAPILAAYRYTTRPFNLALALHPLAQGDSLNQVVDRAALQTRISTEGQVLTDTHYFLKSRGQPHFRLAAPKGMQLWSAAVNGAPVVPVADGAFFLVPLPQNPDPNTVLIVDMKWAGQSPAATQLQLAAPTVDAPVLLAEWKLIPDTGRRLVYRRGSLEPVTSPEQATGLANISACFTGGNSIQSSQWLAMTVVLLGATLVSWRWATQNGSWRFGPRHLLGAGLGILALLLAAIPAIQLGQLCAAKVVRVPHEISLLAPVQQAGSTITAEVRNLPEGFSASAAFAEWWPVLVAIVLWALSFIRPGALVKGVFLLAGWAVLLWAALRAPNGGPLFLLLTAAALVIHAIVPAGRQLFQLPPRPRSAPVPPPVPPGGTAPATAAILILAALLSPNSLGAPAKSSSSSSSSSSSILSCNADEQPQNPAQQAATNSTPAVAESVKHDIRVEEAFALGTVQIRWRAEKDDTLPLLDPTAVLTGIRYPTNSVALLSSAGNNDGPSHRLLAHRAGVYEIEASYQVRTSSRDATQGFVLPVPFALVNTVSLTVTNRDVQVFSSRAISIDQESSGSNTVARLVLPPTNDIWLGWKPRTRDVGKERALFYAELQQLYAPSAGMLEGAHLVSIRPAQGQVTELVFSVPQKATITDVADPRLSQVATDGNKSRPVVQNRPSIVSFWRYDPDTRKLRVSLSPAQSRPFTILVRSQLAAGPLPLDESVSLLAVDGAAAQLGLVGVATPADVQLDSAEPARLSPVNLEDFPADTIAVLQPQMPGLAVRRAFRYSDVDASLALKASAVQPDVRVESQDTLSLGEDRTVLAANATVEIARAGIFKLSFLLPPTFDVESISGSALSHWTDLKSDEGRVITLHLTGKTEGQQKFVLSLAGPGVRGTNNWVVPQLLFREASKQRGTLVLVPEQGLRLQVASSDAVTQLDPQKSGISQRGVLAFRVLQTPWRLALGVEQVPAWVQVGSLQHALVGEANVKLTATLQYQIENTGLKVFHVFLPTNAESIRFEGDQVADFRSLPALSTNGLKLWEIKLHRRVIGAYLLKALYETRMPQGQPEAVLQGLEVADVNLQRGFVTLEAAGRLQLQVDSPPPALQPAEWQSIPRPLQAERTAAPANFTFRLVEPSFSLPLKIQRHEAARLLPARVNSVLLRSVVSDDGVMLTQVRVELVPGDKRLLHLTLPANARFWFAFVNQNGVWPWREQDRVLIPLEQPASREQPILVEFYYSSRAAVASAAALQLLAPKLDLPLENISWQVSVSDHWRLRHAYGSLQFEKLQFVPQIAAVDLGQYLQHEGQLQQSRTKQAEEMLAFGNSALQSGDPQQARRAFQSAFGLSTHDAAFNEDARVQLNNVKVQQAFVGLNFSQAAAGGAPAPILFANKIQAAQAKAQPAYTQQEAKQLLDRNTAEENAALTRLAERLVQQQDAAVSSPAPLRASMPEQGRILTFRRAVLVDPSSPLNLSLQLAPAKPLTPAVTLLALAAALAFIALGRAAAVSWKAAR